MDIPSPLKDFVLLEKRLSTKAYLAAQCELVGQSFKLYPGSTPDGGTHPSDYLSPTYGLIIVDLCGIATGD